MSVVTCFDAISANYGGLPAGQRAGYTTGSSIIVWTVPLWAANPGAIRICQDAGATDDTADVLDVESGAATPADVPGWVKRARAAYAANTRPGQREPMVYCAGGTLTAVANALTAAKITDVPVFLAHPGVGVSAATTAVDDASGPFPMNGVQYDWPGYGLAANAVYDVSVISAAWLAKQSGVSGNTVSQGSSGPAVKALQELLNAAGATPVLTIDGMFGAGTLSAVKGFQARTKLTTDGVAGPATWAALKAYKPPVPVTPPAVLVATAKKVVTVAYSIVIDRAISGYKGIYATKVTGTVAGKAWTYEHNTTEATVTVSVPAPGTYQVTTGATGHVNVVHAVVVGA